jgi:carboxyl-terminal processing protease
MPMKKQMLLVAVLAALSVQAGAAVPEKTADQLKPLVGQTQAALWASRVLTKLHYKSTPLDDAMSEKIFDRYFKSLDSEKCSSRRPTSTSTRSCAPASTTPSPAKT